MPTEGTGLASVFLTFAEHAAILFLNPQLWCVMSNCCDKKLPSIMRATEDGAPVEASAVQRARVLDCLVQQTHLGRREPEHANVGGANDTPTGVVVMQN